MNGTRPRRSRFLKLWNRTFETISAPAATVTASTIGTMSSPRVPWSAANQTNPAISPPAAGHGSPWK